MFIAGEILGMAEWIIDDTCLVLLCFLPGNLAMMFFFLLISASPISQHLIFSVSHSLKAIIPVKQTLSYIFFIRHFLHAFFAVFANSVNPK